MLIFVLNCSVLSEISIFRRNFQMVTCTISGTCHYTRLIWPELTRWTTFVWKIRWPNRIRRDSLGVKTSNASPIFCGSLLILLFFLKICQMVICPVTGTYNHDRYFFAQEWKKPLNLPVERHFEWLNAYICFKLTSSLRNFNFSPEFSDGDMYNQRYMSPRD